MRTSSAINPDHPASPNATTASVRANFQAARDEIEELQEFATGEFMHPSGATMHGPLHVDADFQASGGNFNFAPAAGGSFTVRAPGAGPAGTQALWVTGSGINSAGYCSFSGGGTLGGSWHISSSGSMSFSGGGSMHGTWYWAGSLYSSAYMGMSGGGYLGGNWALYSALFSGNAIFSSVDFSGTVSGQLYGGLSMSLTGYQSFSGGGHLGGNWNLNGSNWSGTIYGSLSINSNNTMGFSGGGYLSGTWALYTPSFTGSAYFQGAFTMHNSGSMGMSGGGYMGGSWALHYPTFTGSAYFSDVTLIGYGVISWSGNAHFQVGANFGLDGQSSSYTSVFYGPLHARSDAAKPGGGSWANLSSDIRTKTEIVAYTAGLSEIIGLEPIRYRYNGRADTPTLEGPFYGFDAAKVEAVMPEMVFKRRVRLDPGDLDDTDILSIDSSPLLYALVNSCKDLAARVEVLERRVLH